MKTTIFLAVVGAIFAIAFGAPAANILEADWGRAADAAEEFQKTFNTTAATIAKIALDDNAINGKPIADAADLAVKNIAAPWGKVRSKIQQRSLTLDDLKNNYLEVHGITSDIIEEAGPAVENLSEEAIEHIFNTFMESLLATGNMIMQICSALDFDCSEDEDFKF